MERPLAISRCVCDSVVRAPMAAQVIRSAMYCGTIGSRNSVAAGKPMPVISSSSFRAIFKPVSMSCEPSRCGSLIKPFPADGRARLFKIDAHDDFHFVGKFLLQFAQPRRVFQRAFFVVNRARPDDDEQARVFLPQNADDAFARLRATMAFTASGVGDSAFKARGDEQRDDFFDMQILRAIHEMAV